jgi:WXG100 family type VII secretion target
MSVSTKFSIENNAVNTHATNLDTAVAALNGQAGAFLSAIEALPAVWKGSSFGSWDALTQAWHEAMAQLNSALTDVKSRVGNAGQLYDSYESEQTSQIDSVMGSASWDSTKFRG